MVNIHIAKDEARLLNAVKKQFTIQLATVMRRDVHNDHRFFALRLIRDWRRFIYRFRLRCRYGFRNLESLLRWLGRWLRRLRSWRYLRNNWLFRLRLVGRLLNWLRLLTRLR